MFVVNAGVDVTASNFYTQILERILFVLSICFVQMKFDLIQIFMLILRILKIQRVLIKLKLL